MANHKLPSCLIEPAKRSPRVVDPIGESARRYICACENCEAAATPHPDPVGVLADAGQAILQHLDERFNAQRHVARRHGKSVIGRPRQFHRIPAEEAIKLCKEERAKRAARTG